MDVVLSWKQISISNLKHFMHFCTYSSQDCAYTSEVCTVLYCSVLTAGRSIISSRCYKPRDPCYGGTGVRTAMYRSVPFTGITDEGHDKQVLWSASLDEVGRKDDKNDFLKTGIIFLLLSWITLILFFTISNSTSLCRLIVVSDCQGYKLPAWVPGQGTPGKGQGHNIPTLIKPIPHQENHFWPQRYLGIPSALQATRAPQNNSR